jgi:hypothetical protein
MEEKKMVEEKSWDTFRDAGLLLFINQVLHIFGWAIVVEIDDNTKAVVRAYPARVRFRGFDNDSVTESYKRLTRYLFANVNSLLEEAEE